MKLIIDDRERAVIAHTAVLGVIGYNIQRLHAGDYHILGHDGKILAAFERKTLADAAASFKDGRWTNRDKLFDLRRETGCAIVFIIEGLPVQNDNYSTTDCGGRLYSDVESSLIRMMIRDDTRTIWTKNTADTAQTLVRWWHALYNVDATEPPSAQPISNSNVAAAPAVDPQPINPPPYSDVAPAVRPRVPLIDQSDIKRAAKMWTTIGGITGSNVKPFMSQMSLTDLIFGRIPDNLVTANGDRINANLLAELKEIGAGRRPNIERKMLGGVFTIGLDAAKVILKDRQLRDLLLMSVDQLAEIKSNVNKLINATRAKRILSTFDYVADTRQSDEELVLIAMSETPLNQTPH